MDKTRKEFKEFLNKEDQGHKHKNGRFGQRKRLYGDYLWSQDRDQFEVDYQEHLEAIKRAISLDEMAERYIADTPEEFQSKDAWVTLIDERIDSIIDYAEALGYKYNESKEIFE